MQPELRDKLIVALSLEEVLNQLNKALKARKGVITLDFRGHSAQVFIEMPGVPKHLWFDTNRRTKVCLHYHPKDLSLRALTDDLHERLRTQDAKLGIGVKRMKDQRYVAKLMVFFDQSDRAVISLITATKGQRVAHNSFAAPRNFNDL